MRFEVCAWCYRLTTGLVFLSNVFAAGTVSPSVEIGSPTLTFSHAAAVNFESGPGSMSVSDVILAFPLSNPVSLNDSLVMYPSMGIRSSILSFERIPTSVIDSTPQNLTVYPAVFRMSDLVLLRATGSRWIHGATGTVKLASDLREITSEDLGFEFEWSSSCSVSSRLRVGAGLGVSLAENDKQVHPGVSINWLISDDCVFNLTGVNWSLWYSPDSTCFFGLRGYSTHEIWSMLDSADESLTLKAESYRVGLFTSRRISEGLWMGLGSGLVVDQRIKLDDMYGRKVVNARLDPAWFVEFSLNFIRW